MYSILYKTPSFLLVLENSCYSLTPITTKADNFAGAMRLFFKKIFSFLLLGLFILKVNAAGFDIKTSSIIDQPAIEVLGDYNNNWYVIGFEKPNHPDKPARFYILKYAAGFPTAKSSPVYPPFGEKTDYLKAAIVNGKLSIFYSRCERVVERPDMVDSREGYKQIPKILRQDYDPVTLLPEGEPVVIFDEAVEHFAASGIELAQSDDKSKTAILIKHYFRQQKFKVLLIDNNKGLVLERCFALKTEKNDLIVFKNVVVGNDGQILLEAKNQADPLHLDTKDKKGPRYYFFSINSKDDEPKMLNPDAEINTGQPVIAILNNGQMLISTCYYTNAHSLVLKSIGIKKYAADFTAAGAYNITPDNNFITDAASYQKTKEKGLENVEIRQILPLDGGGFMLIAEYRHSTDTKDKVTGSISTTLERHYLLAYRFNDLLSLTGSNFIDKKQTTHTFGYAFSAQAYRKGNNVYLLHNDDCESDDEHGLYLLNTLLPANGGEPNTQKIVHTSEDFFTSLEHIYTGTDNRILFIEAKVVDFSVEARELKLLEVKVR